MATRLLLASHHVPQPSQHHSRETPSAALSLRWSKAAQGGWNHASLFWWVEFMNQSWWRMGLLGWLRFQESQVRSIIFMLRHMPSIYRGAHNNFWSVLHGTFMLLLVLAELRLTQVLFQFNQHTPPTRQVDLQVPWVLVTRSRIKHPSSNLQDHPFVCHSAMAPTCRKAQGVECTAMQLPWPLESRICNYSQCTKRSQNLI